MATDITLTTIDAMVKELYSKRTPGDAAMERHDALNWVPKKGGFVGEYKVVPITFGHGVGRAGTFADAQGNASGGSHLKFNVTREHDYGVMTIDAETIYATKGDMGAFVEARKRELDGLMSEMGKSAAFALFGDGNGAIAQMNNTTAVASTDVMTLADAETARRFEVGMILELADTTTPTTPRSGTLTVDEVSVSAGTVTVTAANIAAGVAAAEVDDYILVEGDDAGKMTGFAGWIPLTAPSSGESFFGADRSQYPTRCAGYRYDDTSQSIADSLLHVSEQVAAQGGRPDTAWLSHGNFTVLAKELGAKVEYQGAGGKADIGFASFPVHTSAGVVKVRPDTFCPGNRCYVLERGTWELCHLKGFPHIVNDDGRLAQRQASSDGIEIRVRAWGNVICYKPWCNGVFSIA